MKSEYGYLGFFGLTLIISVLSFVELLQKYTYITAAHFVKSCYVSLTAFFTSIYHFVGFVIFIMVLLSALYFFIKVLVSAWKTHKRMKSFTHSNLAMRSKKISQICYKHAIDPQLVLVSRHSEPLAFTLGFFAPRVVVTTGLVKTLSPLELEAVILHEFHHLKHYHGLLLFIGEVIASTLTFLPFLKDVVLNMKVGFEHDADNFAVQSQKTAKHVQIAISKLINVPLELQFTPAFALTTTHYRLRKLKGKPYPSFIISTFRTMSSIVMLSILGILFILPARIHAAEMSNLVLNSEECSDGLQCSSHCRSEDLVEPINKSIKPDQPNFSSVN